MLFNTSKPIKISVILLLPILISGLASCKKTKSGDELESVTNSCFLKASMLTNTLSLDDHEMYGRSNRNSSSVLGTGNSNNEKLFIRVLDQIKDISIKDSRALVLRNDNSVWVAGSNGFDELGSGSPPLEVRFKKNVRLCAKDRSGHVKWIYNQS